MDLSMETKHEAGQMHIHPRNTGKGGLNTVNMQGGQSTHSLETSNKMEVSVCGT